MCRPALSRGQKLARHGRMRATVNIQVTCSSTACAKAEEELKDSSTKDCCTLSCFTMSFRGTPFGLPYGFPFPVEDQQYMNAVATRHHPTYLPPLQYYTSVPPPPPYPIYPQPLPQLHPFSIREVNNLIRKPLPPLNVSWQKAHLFRSTRHGYFGTNCNQF